jgi:hypothetical protein
MKTTTIVDIIVINWNSGNKTINALLCYLNEKKDNLVCNIIVVDNGSKDNSLNVLKNKEITLIKNDENIGFGKACNQAFEICNGDYVLLLNPDTESSLMVLEKLVSIMENNPEYAIIGPQQKNEHGEIIRTCGRFPSFISSVFELTSLSKLFPTVFLPTPIMKEWDHSESRDVDHIMGSYFLIKRSVLKEIGGMDDRFFVYFEDLDLSKRVINKGYKIHYTTSCNIIHEGGGSGEKEKEKRLLYSINSRRIYWKKYFGTIHYLILVFLSLTIELPIRIINTLFREKRVAFFSTTQIYISSLKSLIKKKEEIQCSL